MNIKMIRVHDTFLFLVLCSVQKLVGENIGGKRRLENNSTFMHTYLGFPGSSLLKNPLANVGDPDLIPGLERSPGEGIGNPLQFSWLGNPMDRGVWQVNSPWDHRVRDN